MEDDFHGGFKRGLCDLEMDEFAADWLKDKMEGKYPPDLARRVLIPTNGMGPYT